MPNKFPAFQFYAKEFIADRNVSVMSAKEVGAYWLLICACWIEEDLPTDLYDLAATARMPFKEFSKSWEMRIARCFKLDEKKNVFFHPRLRKEIRKQKAFSQQQSDKGKESGRKRRQNKQDKPRTVVEPRFTSGSTNREPNRTLHIPYSGNDTSNEVSKEGKSSAKDFGEPRGKPKPLSLFHHPAMEALRLVTKHNPPKETWALLANKLGKDIDIGKLTVVYAEWLAKGNKPTNWDGITDWYLDKRQFNGTNQRQSEREKSAQRGANAERMADALRQEAFAELQAVSGDSDRPDSQIDQLGQRTLSN